MTKKDPICGMNVDPKKAETKSLVISKKGKKYYFCSQGCKDTFSGNKHLTEILLSTALILIAIIVYYLNAEGLMIDKKVNDISPINAILISLIFSLNRSEVSKSKRGSYKP